MSVAIILTLSIYDVNPFDTEATYFEGTRMQKILEVFQTLSISHVGIYWKALGEYSQMSTRMLGF